MVDPFYCVESVRDRNAGAFSLAPPRESDDAYDNSVSSGNRCRIGRTCRFRAGERRSLGSHLGDIRPDLSRTGGSAPGRACRHNAGCSHGAARSRRHRAGRCHASWNHCGSRSCHASCSGPSPAAAVSGESDGPYDRPHQYRWQSSAARTNESVWCNGGHSRFGPCCAPG